MLGFWTAMSLGLVVRLGQIQLLEGAVWSAEARAQHQGTQPIPAERGSILDRDGTPLALTHESYRVSLAPHEVLDRDGTVDRLGAALELPRRDLERALDSGRRWVVLGGRYGVTDRVALQGMRGVYVERDPRRFYPHGNLVAGVLGSVIDGEGRGGIEQTFDSILSGVGGEEVVARDARGAPIPGEAWVLRAPKTGGQVVLTLDVELQEIAQEALASQVEATGADGGDLLITDPATGEILAMASIREGKPAGLSALNAPYEPGSTLKPFTVAALLEQGVASLKDSVDTGDGRWTVHGRTISDVSRVGKTDLAGALRVSSNVGIAMLARGMSPAAQYESLRDFGFGTPTGLPLAGEEGGLLRRPSRWSAQSPVSLAIGYEVSVTPLQMAMAYGALANGGVLMEPRLIREVRDERGTTLESWHPRPVRRVLAPRNAEALREVLVQVVEEGTGTAARMTTFRVAGKSGTSRAYSPGGGYAQGRYFASFVGFFPADDPQLVVFVKLDSPQGTYYGGATAAPVTRATLEAVLAARRAPIDRAPLAVRQASGWSPEGDEDAPAPRTGSAIRPASLLLGPPVEPDPDFARVPAGGVLSVPDLRGLPPRAAVRRLHALGLRAEWDGSAQILGMDPEAGTPVVSGSVVRLSGGGGE